MINYFRGIDEKPYHLSVGTVLVNQAYEVACHKFADGSYSLMRETMEPGETIEQALARGLLEEFGAEAELITYIGSSVTSFTRKGKPIQKTTLYFLMQLLSIDDNRRSLQDDEEDSQVAWRSIDALLNPAYSQEYHKPTFGEAGIVQRAATILFDNSVKN